ncbi:hypothetical protein [Flavobacterium filum]|uniref:hypothetical protein n=1 Tax=Flavobacterium TaxID=237 RepID=UPI0003F9B67F|nr:hypothetical protein [Flavobacterium filum]
MKNIQTKKSFEACHPCDNESFHRFLKNSVSATTFLPFECTESTYRFHEKLPIIFANIRV